MLSPCPLSPRKVVRASQFEPGRFSNLRRLTAKPNRAYTAPSDQLRCRVTAWRGNQTSSAPTRVRCGNHWRACAPVSGRDLSQYDLADATGQYDELGGGHAGHRALGDVFEVGGLPAATPPCRRSFRCLLGFRGATLPLFQCLAGVSPLARAKFLRPYATRGRPQVRYSLDQGSRQRLLRAAPSYQLCSRHR